MQEKCSRCGSLYELTKVKIPLRDKDFLECDICGAKLISWNGGLMYTKKLIKKEPYEKDDE